MMAVFRNTRFSVCYDVVGFCLFVFFSEIGSVQFKSSNLRNSANSLMLKGNELLSKHIFIFSILFLGNDIVKSSDGFRSSIL